MIDIPFFIFQVGLFVYPSDLNLSVISCLEIREENDGKQLDVDSYVQIIRDALFLHKSVCLARNFPSLQKEDLYSRKQKVFIDVWPVCSFLSLSLSLVQIKRKQIFV